MKLNPFEKKNILSTKTKAFLYNETVAAPEGSWEEENNETARNFVETTGLSTHRTIVVTMTSGTEHSCTFIEAYGGFLYGNVIVVVRLEVGGRTNLMLDQIRKITDSGSTYHKGTHW